MHWKVPEVYIYNIRVYTCIPGFWKSLEGLVSALCLFAVVHGFVGFFLSLLV